MTPDSKTEGRGEYRLTAPIHPGELDKKMRRGLSDLVDRVTAKAVIEGRGQDFLLRVYIAGVYHGALLQEEKNDEASR